MATPAHANPTSGNNAESAQRDPSPDAILEAILQANHNPIAAATNLNIPLTRLLRLIKHPDYLQRFSDFQNATQEFLALREAQSQITAINLLESSALAASKSGNLAEIRRAASALASACSLRVRNYPRTGSETAERHVGRSHSSAPPARSSSPTPPSHPPSPAASASLRAMSISMVSVT